MAPPTRPHILATDLSPQQATKAEAFMRANLPLTDVPGTGLRLHLAGPRSRLSRLVPPGGTPYWAHAWPGGVALAMHLRVHPGTARGRLALDLGTGSGLVALAALLAGAGSAMGFDADPLAKVAAALNARANELRAPLVHSVRPDRLAEVLLSLQAAEPPLILVGDVFYDEAAARQLHPALDAMAGRAEILVGDIGRRFLPRDRLEPLASYPVRDLGDPPSAPIREGWVFRWNAP